MSNDSAAPSPTSRGGNFAHMVACFLVGCFAGSLASFFPRLTAFLAGDPTQKNVTLFSHQYLMVGGIVALIVGIVIVIIESKPDRGLGDVFMTALGIPTLLMGALGTSATKGNIDTLQQQLNQALMVLSTQAGVAIRGDNASVPQLPPQSSWQPWQLLGTSALAAGQGMPASPAQNSLGISVKQDNYYLIYAQGSQRSELEAVQAKLKAAGIETRITAGSKGDVLLVPQEQPIRPYAQAVQDAVRAKEAGAAPYLVPAPGP